MAINDMDVVQSSLILASAINQAQGGQSVSTQIATKDFVTVAQLALKTGYDKLSTALSQVLSKSIFSERPYTRRFQILEADAIRYGNHVRKINYVDGDLEDSEQYSLTDGQSIDMYEVHKPKVVQTNFYGYNTFDYVQTIYRDQLEMSLRGPEEWAGFLGGLLTNVQNKIEQAHEESARMCINNLIAGHAYLNDYNVIHLLSEYNAYTGLTLTATTVRDPANWPGFARWMFGRLETLSHLLEERTSVYHVNLTGSPFMRHTPAADQRLILLAGEMNQISTNVLATTYNSEYLKTIPREDIAFWQNINLPSDINVDCTYMGYLGSLLTQAVQKTDVFGVLFDKEAAGYTMVNQSYEVTPYNVRGKYWNHFWSFQDRYWNDFTENAIVLLLD